MSVDLPQNLPRNSSPNSITRVNQAETHANQNRPTPNTTSPSPTTTNSSSTNSVTNNEIAVNKSTANNLVTALVLQTVKTASSSFDVTINIEGKQLLVKSSVALQPNEQLKLELTPNGGLKLLEIIAQKQQAVINDAIRPLISQQNSYQPLLSALLTLSAKNPATSSMLNGNPSHQALSAETLKSINRLIDNLPQYKDFQSGGRIKTSLAESGIQFENKLANSVQGFNSNSFDPKSTTPGSTTTQNLNDNRLIGINKITPAIQQMIKTDFKANLLNLMTNLLKAQQSTASNPQSIQTQTTQAQTLQQIATLIAFESGQLTSTVNQNGTRAQINELQKALAAELAKANTKISPFFDTVAKPPLMGTYFLQAQPMAKIDTKPKSWMDSIVATLVKLTLSSLSRMQLHQLASLPQQQDGQTSQSWSLDLPVLHQNQVHLFHIQIQEEEPPVTKDNKKEKMWKVSLAFDIEPLGAMHVQLTMIGETANATIWAEQSNTVDYTHSHLQFLTNSLRKIGLTVNQIDCLEGKPSEKKANLQQRLVDINT